MPLQSIGTPGYIKRTKVFAHFRSKPDETGDLVVPAETHLEYEVEFKEEVQNVVGVELRSYHIRTALSPTVVGRYRNPAPFAIPSFPAPTSRELNNGNHVLDVEITKVGDPSTVAVMKVDMDAVASVYFTAVPLPPGWIGESLPDPVAGYNMRTHVSMNSVDDLFSSVLFHLNSVFAKDPDYAAFAGDFLRDTNTDVFHLYTAAGDDVKILFASGGNNADSIHQVLGFEKADTLLDPESNGARAPFVGNLRPFRYVDVSIKELPEFRPHSRIFMDFDNFSKPTNPNPRTMRLLTRPHARGREARVLPRQPLARAGVRGALDRAQHQRTGLGAAAPRLLGSSRLFQAAHVLLMSAQTDTPKFTCFNDSSSSSAQSPRPPPSYGTSGPPRLKIKQKTNKAKRGPTGHSRWAPASRARCRCWRAAVGPAPSTKPPSSA